jgi:hypothetical protein
VLCIRTILLYYSGVQKQNIRDILHFSLFLFVFLLDSFLCVEPFVGEAFGTFCVVFMLPSFSPPKSKIVAVNMSMSTCVTVVVVVLLAIIDIPHVYSATAVHSGKYI